MRRDQASNSRTAPLIAGLALLGLALRLAIDLILWSSGYFFGEDADTFFRLGLSWRWANHPFFIPGHWVPLQFVIVGLVHRILSPWLHSASVWIPVAINHISFLGSLAITAHMARRFGGWLAAAIAVALAVFLTQDVWLTFSGLTEPFVILCGIAIGAFAFEIWSSQSEHAVRFFIASAATASLAAAAHYVGWYLVAFVVAETVAHALRKPTRNPTPALIPTIMVAISFPVAWMIANWARYGNPLRFLAKASSYHLWFLEQPTLTRAASLLSALIKSEPLMLALALPSIYFTARKRPSTLWYLSPGLAYLIFLLISAVMAWGVPTLHARYIVFPLWLTIPFAADVLSRLVNSPRLPVRISLLFLTGGLLAAQFVRSLRYVNWADPSTREAAAYLQSQMSGEQPPGFLYIEEEPALYPDVALGAMSGRPDKALYLSGDELNRLWRESLLPQGPPSGLVVATDPITIGSLQRVMAKIATFGDYVIFSSSQPPSRAATQAITQDGWSVLDSSQLNVATSPGTLFFGFPGPPQMGTSEVGLHRSFEVAVNGCYIISFQVMDRFPEIDLPWIVLQQLVVNNIVLWSHDVASDGFSGWQEVEYYLMPTGPTVSVTIRALAQDPSRTEFNWPEGSMTGISSFDLSECP